MSKGIKVIWCDNGNIDEVEYFCGIDVDHLAHIPPITSVRASWPRYEGGISVEYHVNVRYEREVDGEVRLVVDYRSEFNPILARDYDISWGTNAILLNEGERTGPCVWEPNNPEPVEPGRYSVHWEAFDLGKSHARTLGKYWGSKRDSRFRGVILDCDGSRCVLTGETTTQTLEAAHLIPAKNGENDMPFNGIALRADLHRMFDAGLFTFGENGEVVFLKKSKLSMDYCRLLRDKSLPEPTLERVRATLTHPQFQKRSCSSYRVDSRRH